MKKIPFAATAITAVVPAYNAANVLALSLPPLLAMIDRGELGELLVIDDGSDDGSATLARHLGARVIANTGRGGPGAARNLGAAHAGGDIVWFVDADVVVNADASRILADGFSTPDIVAVFGSYDDRPGAANFLSQYKNLIHHYYHQKGKRDASTFWSGCGAVRKQSFQALGGFDTVRYPYPSIEDIELGYRLRAAGGRILMLSSLQAKHLKEWRFFNLIHTEVLRRALPWSRLIFKQKQMPNDLNVGSGERWRAAAAGALLLTCMGAPTPLLPVWAPIPALVAVGAVNSPLARFFTRQKGVLFAIRGVAFHQLYYLYSGSVFVYAYIESLAARRARWRRAKTEE